MLDRQIVKGLLFQTLANSEGIHQARAASETHADILDLLIWWFKGLMAAMIRYDICKPLLKLNFGDEYAESYLPGVSLGDSERRHWAEDADKVAKLLPHLTESQKTNLLVSIQIPEPLEGEEYPRGGTTSQTEDKQEEQTNNG